MNLEEDIDSHGDRVRAVIAFNNSLNDWLDQGEKEGRKGERRSQALTVYNNMFLCFGYMQVNRQINPETDTLTHTKGRSPMAFVRRVRSDSNSSIFSHLLSAEIRRSNRIAHLHQGKSKLNDSMTFLTPLIAVRRYTDPPQIFFLIILTPTFPNNMTSSNMTYNQFLYLFIYSFERVKASPFWSSNTVQF